MSEALVEIPSHLISPVRSSVIPKRLPVAAFADSRSAERISNLTLEMSSLDRRGREIEDKKWKNADELR